MNFFFGGSLQVKPGGQGINQNNNKKHCFILRKAILITSLNGSQLKVVYIYQVNYLFNWESRENKCPHWGKVMPYGGYNKFDHPGSCLR